MLAGLFSHAVGPKVGLRTPTALHATGYKDAAVTRAHRSYETLSGLSQLLDLPIQSPDPLGQDAAFAEAVLSSGAIPAVWPGDRFDVIWTFTLDRDRGRYVFAQVPQQLLGGDTTR
jgi:hypothetical protein